MVRLAIFALGLGRRATMKKFRQAAQPGETAFEREAEPLCRRLRLGGQIVVLELREIDEAAVMAEIIVAQLRKAIEAESLNDQPVEMADEKVGEEERAELLLRHRREVLGAGKKFIAMRAGNALDARLFEHAVELAAGAAIAVEA